MAGIEVLDGGGAKLVDCLIDGNNGTAAATDPGAAASEGGEEVSQHSPNDAPSLKQHMTESISQQTNALEHDLDRQVEALVHDLDPEPSAVTVAADVPPVHTSGAQVLVSGQGSRLAIGDGVQIGGVDGAATGGYSASAVAVDGGEVLLEDLMTSLSSTGGDWAGFRIIDGDPGGAIMARERDSASGRSVGVHMAGVGGERMSAGFNNDLEAMLASAGLVMDKVDEEGGGTF